jgi:hypothetical protein
MAQRSLLQELEEVANKVRLLEREKSEAVMRTRVLEREKAEAVAAAQELERENKELISLITLVGAKVQEILKVGAPDEVSQSQAVNAPAKSAALGQLGEFSSDSQKQAKRLFPHASIPE